MDSDAPTFRSGQRVRYVGLTGDYAGTTGRVSRMVRGGVKVKWDNGNVDVVHPDDVRLVEPKGKV